MRKLLVAGIAGLLSVAVLAAPASAKKHSPDEFAFIATLDCGKGAFVTGSGAETSSPLVDLKTGKTYLPVEWNLAIGDDTYHEAIPNRYKGQRLVCGYDDGFATGEVIVVRSTGNRND